MKNINDRMVFWSPSIIWKKVSENELQIQNYMFKGAVAELFPDFYYKTGSGIIISDLYKAFENFDQILLQQFIEKLLDRKLLIFNVQEFDELFFSQNKLFKPHNPYDENIIFDANKLNQFVEKVLTREYETGEKVVKLMQTDVDEIFTKRCTTRNFNTTELITLQQFSALLNILSQRVINGKRKYYFASAGGLYPIDYYIYIKANRVADISEGLYVYLPIENEIRLIGVTNDILKDAHYFLNQHIFENSAFSIYFIYDTCASMPKYGGLGYYYAIIDSGIIVQALTMMAEALNIGSCSIGEMDFRKISHNFKLSKNKIYLHCMEFGLKKEELKNEC